MLGDPVNVGLNSPLFVWYIQDLIAKYFFVDSLATLLAMPREEYHAIVARVQDHLNKKRYAHIIVHDVRKEIMDCLRTREILVQKHLYLRAARPIKDSESIGWHRESFYGGTPGIVNLWLPVLNVSTENVIRYVPGSASISDADIITESDDDGAVTKLSDGHRIGFLYAPKRIVSGVDLTKAIPLSIKIGELALFSGDLIHGAAPNNGNNIRFSIDFRLIAAENMVPEAKDYYVPLDK